jgi:hypothetical protein
MSAKESERSDPEAAGADVFVLGRNVGYASLKQIIGSTCGLAAASSPCGSTPLRRSANRDYAADCEAPAFGLATAAGIFSTCTRWIGIDSLGSHRDDLPG